MTMIYHPIPFVKLVKKFLVGNYEPIMRICGKIFTNNLHNGARHSENLFLIYNMNSICTCLD